MKKIISTDNAPKAIGPYNQAINVDNMLFISGQIPLDLKGNIPSDITSQTKQVLENIKAILNEAKFTVNDVVKTTIFLKDMNDFATVNELYANFFDKTFPARSTIEVSRLPKDVLIEIETIAIK